MEHFDRTIASTYIVTLDALIERTQKYDSTKRPKKPLIECRRDAGGRGREEGAGKRGQRGRGAPW